MIKMLIYNFFFAIGMAHYIPEYTTNGQGQDHHRFGDMDEDVDYSNLGGVLFIVFISFITLAIVAFVIYIFVRRRLIRLSEDILREEENQAYLELNSEEQELFFQLKEYLQENPMLRGELTLSQNLLIQEKGVKAWEFIKDGMLTNNDLLILNKTELNFFKKFECSSQTNLPIPLKNEVYYFETKIYSLPNPEETKISIGIGCKPYPWFRLPGRHQHSVSYDSDGYRRHNQPFKFKYDAPFPRLIEGDVVGMGYRVRLGTIFFTRNGKKINELKIGGHIKNFKLGGSNIGQLFPIIGANNLCSLHVNIGQMGFVFIEGNVKKWGFAPLEGNGPAPPIYNKFNPDILLERSEIDDENNDLSERENDFPPNFWDIHGNDEDSLSKGEFNHDKYSYNAYSDVNSNDERITLNSLIVPNRPPSYDEPEEEEEEEEVVEEEVVEEEVEVEEGDDEEVDEGIDGCRSEGGSTEIGGESVEERIEEDAAGPVLHEEEEGINGSQSEE